MNNLIHHRDAYKQALKAQDETALLHEKACLTAAAGSALLEQDAEAIRRVRACCADLSSLADRLDITGKPGDRWRALGDVLTLALESGKPLEQLRLVLPSTVGGLIMKHIKDQPGLTPTDLSQRCGKNKTHISNEIKKLENAGLIHRFKRGKNYELFLSVLGKEALDSIAPLKIVPMMQVKREHKYEDPNRLRKLTESGAPQLPFAALAQ
jgi:DNA-binding MarR family transcriptional regulator